MMDNLNIKSEIKEMMKVFEVVVDIAKQTKDFSEKEVADLRQMFTDTVSEMEKGSTTQIMRKVTMLCLNGYHWLTFINGHISSSSIHGMIYFIVYAHQIYKKFPML